MDTVCCTIFRLAAHKLPLCGGQDQLRIRYVESTEFSRGQANMRRGDGFAMIPRKKSSRDDELILPPNFSEEQKEKKVFTELKADFTRNRQTQGILLR